MSSEVTDDRFDGPSRSQQRRDALAILELAETLVGLPDAELARIPLGEDIVAEVRRARAIRQQIARKRQTQFLAKQMRRLDDEQIEPIRKALDHDRHQAAIETAHLHHAERWRDRLLAEGDVALAEWLERHPAGDSQKLRALTRQARLEAERGKPPRAARELFRLLRDTPEETRDAADGV